LDTGWDIIFGEQVSPFDLCPFSPAKEPVATKGTLLHDPFCPDGDISIQRTFHLLRPFGWIPVKVFDRVRTGRGAIPATDASVIDLSYESFFIDVGCIDRADLGAGRIVTMHAWSWKKPGFDVRVLSFDIGYQFDPVNGATLSGLLWPNDRHIVFCLTGDHASLTGSAFI